MVYLPLTQQAARALEVAEYHLDRFNAETTQDDDLHLSIRELIVSVRLIQAEQERLSAMLRGLSEQYTSHLGGE